MTDRLLLQPSRDRELERDEWQNRLKVCGIVAAGTLRAIVGLKDAHLSMRQVPEEPLCLESCSE